MEKDEDVDYSNLLGYQVRLFITFTDNNNNNDSESFKFARGQKRRI